MAAAYLLSGGGGGTTWIHPGAPGHVDTIHTDKSPGYVDQQEMNAHLLQLKMALQIQNLFQAFVVVIAAQEFEQMKDRAHSVGATLFFFAVTAFAWRFDVWLQQVLNAGTPYSLAVRFLQLLTTLTQAFTAYIFLKMLLELLLFDVNTGLIDRSQLMAPLAALILLSSVVVFLQYLVDPTPLRSYSLNLNLNLKAQKKDVAERV